MVSMQSVSVSRRNGFTIVELIIVIVVIAVLATVALVAYNGIQDRARAAKANSELQTLSRAIMTAREGVDKTLYQITGSNCTRCLNTQASYEAALNKISAASGANLEPLKSGDPWGNRYWIDENEGESGSCTSSRDVLMVRPIQSGVPDILVPFYRCP